MEVFDETGKRTLYGWAALGLFGTTWFVVAWALPPFGAFAAVVCLICAIFDMMMNGAAYAEFAPWNLTGTALAGIGASIGMN